MATHLKEGKPETLHDLAERAETYLEAHSSDILFGVDPKFSKIRGSLQPKRCHNCGSPDHLRNQCPKPQPPTSPKNQRAPQPTFRPPGPFQKPPSYPATSPRREPPRCFICNKTGHIARDCRSKFTAAMEYQGYYRSHHSRIISSSRRIRILRTTRTSRSQMTWTSHIQNKLQQPQLSDRPDRHM